MTIVAREYLTLLANIMSRVLAFLVQKMAATFLRYCRIGCTILRESRRLLLAMSIIGV